MSVYLNIKQYNNLNAAASGIISEYYNHVGTEGPFTLRATYGDKIIELEITSENNNSTLSSRNIIKLNVYGENETNYHRINNLFIENGLILNSSSNLPARVNDSINLAGDNVGNHYAQNTHARTRNGTTTVISTAGGCRITTNISGNATIGTQVISSGTININTDSSSRGARPPRYTSGENITVTGNRTQTTTVNANGTTTTSSTTSNNNTSLNITVSGGQKKNYGNVIVAGKINNNNQ